MTSLTRIPELSFPSIMKRRDRSILLTLDSSLLVDEAVGMKESTGEVEIGYGKREGWKSEIRIEKDTRGVMDIENGIAEKKRYGKII